MYVFHKLRFSAVYVCAVYMCVIVCAFWNVALHEIQIVTILEISEVKGRETTRDYSINYAK